MLTETLLGFLISLGGFYLAYLYIKDIDQGSSILLAVAAVLLVSLGIVFLIRGGKAADNVITGKTKVMDEVTTVPVQNSFESRLQRNNEYLTTWRKTNEQREKLKMLQIASTPTPESAE